MEEYTRLTEIEEDYLLLIEANRRMEISENRPTVSMKNVMNDLGISEEELEGSGDVVIE